MSAATLPPAPWRDDPALLRLIDALGGADMARVVGGAVRDTCAGLPVSDIDIATRLLPEVVCTRVSDAGMKAVPTGIAHGTVSAVADGRRFEVTTLRRDVATDGRRATVAFTDDWAEDAARRDFTINALYADPRSGAIFDPTGGLADLAAQRVRFIGDAGTRIDEDHLRILRWFRFVARFGGGTVDAADKALITARAPQLRSLSRERIADELLRLLALADPSPSVALLIETGVLDEIAPECGGGACGRVAQLLTNERNALTPPDAVRRLIALLPDDAMLADKVAARLKLSNRIRKRIATARSQSSADNPRARAYRIGMEGAVDQLLLQADDAAAALAQLIGWAVPQLPFSGGDLVALGIAAGPDVARTLKDLEQRWVAAEFPADVDLPQWLAQLRG